MGLTPSFTLHSADAQQLTPGMSAGEDIRIFPETINQFHPKVQRQS
jgi:hypothetical protein